MLPRPSRCSVGRRTTATMPTWRRGSRIAIPRRRARPSSTGTPRRTATARPTPTKVKPGFLPRSNDSAAHQALTSPRLDYLVGGLCLVAAVVDGGDPPRDRLGFGRELRVVAVG